jgi:carboxyl-terminal processing protease
MEVAGGMAFPENFRESPVPALSAMSRSFHRAILGISIAVVLVVFLGAFGPAGVSASQHDGAYVQMGVYEDVLHKIQTDYVTTPNIDEVTNGALHGLLESLDPESSYLTKDEYATYLDHQHEGQAQVGMEVSKRYGYGSVVTVIPGTPAAKANIEDGDLIEAIGGKTTRVMSLAMIRLLLEGKAGTTVTFDLVRPGNPRPDTITLARVNTPPPPLVVQQYRDSGILYLKPTVLTRDRVDEIISHLRAMPKEGDRKVILDLRDTAVGSEDQGIRLANAFLKSGTIAMLAGQTVPTRTFGAAASQFVTAAPVVVLVNGGTAGAAEIIAGAIMDNKRGDVVGERTFGEGGELKTFPLPDGAALLLTVAKYETPDGQKIEDNAVTPNVVVAENQEEFLPGTRPTAQQQHTDDQLNRALEILKQKSA